MCGAVPVAILGACSSCASRTNPKWAKNKEIFLFAYNTRPISQLSELELNWSELNVPEPRHNRRNVGRGEAEILSRAEVL